MEIPKQLRKSNINFVLLKYKSKIPFQQNWQNKEIKYTSSEIQKHFENNGNYGVIGGGEKNLIIVEFDNKEIQEEVIQKLPQTFTVKTGSGLLHKYFYSTSSESFKIMNEEKNTLADIQGQGKQVVGPNSIHPNGSVYEIVDESRIASFDYHELKAILMPYDYSFNKQEDIIIKNKEVETNNQIFDLINQKYSIKEVLTDYGINTLKNPTQCPFHSSKGGKCLGFTYEVAHCFHCNGKWNVFSLVQNIENLSPKNTLEFLCDKLGLKKELQESRRQWKLNHLQQHRSSFPAEVEKDRMEMSKQFYEINPFFYNREKQYFVWDPEILSYVQTNDVELLNLMHYNHNVNIVNSTISNELLRAFKQVGRKNMPPEPNKNWIQFRNKFYDVYEKKQYDIDTNIMNINPLPWKMGNSKETPTIDRIFGEWVGKDKIIILKEIAAVCMLSHMPLHRIFCLIGEGRNGKSSYEKFLKILLGQNNICATDLKRLITGRFEIIKLHKKLMCVIGEVDKGIFNQTGLIKALSGEDLLSGEYKGIDPIDFINYATPIILTNTLPETSDDTDGFYSRWCIVDFPNQFPESRNPVYDIPDEEYENFCLQVPEILKDLLDRGTFAFEGTITDRKKKYENKSNFIKKFINDYCIYVEGEFISFEEFEIRLNDFLSSQKLGRKSKIEISKILTKMNIERKQTTIKNEYGQTKNINKIINYCWKYD